MKETPPTKECSSCHDTKPLCDFYTRSVKGKKYPESRCKTCSITRTKQRKINDPVYAEKYKSKAVSNQQKKRSYERANNIDRFRYVYLDSRKTDRLKGFENDLDISFVEKLISLPCHYCGDTTTQMSLDRISNEVGHLKSNVVQSCLRCNLTRGSMPYEAWVVVAPGMKKAYELGLFGQWTGNKIGRKFGGATG